VVTPTDPVGSAAERRRAVRIATEIAGVTKVVDRLRSLIGIARRTNPATRGSGESVWQQPGLRELGRPFPSLPRLGSANRAGLHALTLDRFEHHEVEMNRMGVLSCAPCRHRALRQMGNLPILEERYPAQPISERGWCEHAGWLLMLRLLTAVAVATGVDHIRVSSTFVPSTAALVQTRGMRPRW
jgi:hypothetical protein